MTEFLESEAKQAESRNVVVGEVSHEENVPLIFPLTPLSPHVPHACVCSLSSQCPQGTPPRSSQKLLE